MARINSRNKGALGERELAFRLREAGFDDAKRGQQFKGGADSPDVAGIPGFHIECKRTEQAGLYKWVNQAINDAGSDNIPVVIHRKNKTNKRGIYEDWVAILPLDEFIKLVKERA